MPSTSHLPFGSVNASVAMVSPLAMPGRSSFFCVVVAGVEDRVRRPSTTDEKNGAQSSARPISSSTMPSSTKLKPAAVLLGDVQALQAELSAICFHTAS